MDARLQRRVQRYGWDRAYPYYEESWKRQLAPAQELLLEKANLQEGEDVLDIACGTGLVTIPAARSVGASGHVVATDLSDRMVESCRDRADRLGLDHVEVRQMDAEDLGFDDASFDCVLCSLGLMYVPDPLAAMREMMRVLRPGGRAVVSVWGERSACGWAEVFPIVDARVASDVCPLFFQLGTGSTLEATYQAAGFVDAATERIDVTLPYESADDALGAIFAGGPVALAYFKFDEETREAVHSEYLASIDAYRQSDAYSVPGQFVVGRGVKPSG